MKTSSDFLYSTKLLYASTHVVIDGDLVKNRDGKNYDQDVTKVIEEMIGTGKCHSETMVVTIQNGCDQHVHCTKTMEDTLKGSLDARIKSLIGKRIFFHTLQVEGE
ncbi:MAG: hypothetical protein HDQ96_05800 [Lachnospiraceae bacterium]|nr:hypothetical protein [Lachnospiraceae bacterium]